jgi:hypothetical protein
MDVSAPAWLDRAITVKEPGMDRTVLAKQLGLIELTPVPVDGFDGISDENPNARDVIVVGQPKDGEDRFAIAAALKVQLKSAGLFKVVVGPTKTPMGDMAFDRLLPRPFLRAAMMTGLSELSPLVAPCKLGKATTRIHI